MPLLQVGELGETAGGDVGGRPTGAVEVYHTLCFLQSREPLRPPLAGIVGGLVTDFDSHRLIADEVSLQGRRGQSGEAVTVHPLTQTVGAGDESAHDGTAGHAFEAVDLPAAGELHPSGARDGVDGQAVNGAAVLADSEDHWCRLN